MTDLDSSRVDVAPRNRFEPVAKAVITLFALTLASDLGNDWVDSLGRVVARTFSGVGNVNSGSESIGSGRRNLEWCCGAMDVRVRASDQQNQEKNGPG